MHFRLLRANAHIYYRFSVLFDFWDAIEQPAIEQTYIKCIMFVRIAERTCMTRCLHSHVNWIEINKWRVRVCFAVGRPEAMPNQNEWSRFQKTVYTPKHVYANIVWILFFVSIYHFDHVCAYKICGQRSRARPNFHSRSAFTCPDLYYIHLEFICRRTVPTLQQCRKRH